VDEESGWIRVKRTVQVSVGKEHGEGSMTPWPITDSRVSVKSLKVGQSAATSRKYDDEDGWDSSEEHHTQYDWGAPKDMI